MERIIAIFILCLFPTFLSAQSINDDIDDGKNKAENTECKKDSVKMTVQEKISGIIDERRNHRWNKANDNAKKTSHKTVGVGNGKKQRGVGFFVQGGVNMSIHK